MAISKTRDITRSISHIVSAGFATPAAPWLFGRRCWRIDHPQTRLGCGQDRDPGCSIPLSGPAAPTGITTQRTVEHALDLINQKGIQIGPDRYTLVAQFYDNKYVPPKPSPSSRRCWPMA